MPSFDGSRGGGHLVARTFLLSLALIVAVPRFAPAQFTTFIPPRRPPEKVDTGKRVAVAKKKAPAPSAAAPRIRLTNMRVWVDSAVGIRSTPRPPTRRDTADTSHDYLSSRDELTSVRRFNVAAADSCQSRFASLPKSISPSVRASRSSRSRAPCSRRVCRFRRIARLPSEWSARSNDAGAVAGDHGSSSRYADRRTRTRGARALSPARRCPQSVGARSSLRDGARRPTARRRSRQRLRSRAARASRCSRPAESAASIATRRSTNRPTSRSSRARQWSSYAPARSRFSIFPQRGNASRPSASRSLAIGPTELPGFFSAETGIALDARVEQASEIAAIYRAHRALGRQQSLLVVQAPPAAFALDRWRVETAVRDAQAEATANDVHGSGGNALLARRRNSFDRRKFARCQSGAAGAERRARRRGCNGLLRGAKAH